MGAVGGLIYTVYRSDIINNYFNYNLEGFDLPDKIIFGSGFTLLLTILNTINCAVSFGVSGGVVGGAYGLGKQSVKDIEKIISFSESQKKSRI